MKLKTQICPKSEQFRRSSLVHRMWNRIGRHIRGKPITQRQQIEQIMLEQHRKEERKDQSQGDMEVYRLLSRPIL